MALPILVGVYLEAGSGTEPYNKFELGMIVVVKIAIWIVDSYNFTNQIKSKG